MSEHHFQTFKLIFPFSSYTTGVMKIQANAWKMEKLQPAQHFG